MNTLYKTTFIATLCLSIIPSSMFAQTAAKDSTLNRQVSLEREYTPTIQDASKINTLPALHEPQTKQYDIKFENTIPNANITSYPIGNPGSGDIRTQIDYSKHRGYLQFGAGMYSNIEGALGYRIVDSKNDQLDIFGTHNSTNGDIKYLDGISSFDKAKAKNMENLVKLKYSHKFESLTWDLSGSYYNNSFNYYGNPFVFKGSAENSTTENIESLEAGMSKNQTVNVIEFETGIRSKENSDAVSYAVNLKFDNFSSKYGPDIKNDGISGNIFEAMADIAAPVQTDHKFGIEGGIFFQKFDDVNYAPIQVLPETEDNPFHNLTIFKANPYYSIEGGNFKLSLGANINWASDIENKFTVSPAINMAWNFDEKSLLYINADGGIEDNNYVKMNRENRYINPGSRVFIAQTLYDVQIGIRSGAITAFEFDIFGGYKYTKDEHLYVTGTTSSWSNVSDVMYANIGTGHLGGLLKTKLIPYTDLSLKATALFDNVSKYTVADYEVEEKEAWGMPTFKVDFNADFSFIDNLTLSVNYIFEGGRKTWISNEVREMNNINELNIKGTYNIQNWISLYVRANNVLGQKYERYLGYTNQGINAIGGINLKF